MNYFNDRNTLNAAIALGAKEARCCLCGKKHEINKSPCSSKLRKLYTAMNDVLYTYTELFSRMTKTIMRNNNAAKKAEKIMSTNGIKYNLAFTPPIENQENCRHLEFLQPEGVCKHIISKLDETYEINKYIMENSMNQLGKLESEQFWDDVSDKLLIKVKEKVFQEQLLNTVFDLHIPFKINNERIEPFEFLWPIPGFTGNIYNGTGKNLRRIIKKDFLGIGFALKAAGFTMRDYLYPYGKGVLEIENINSAKTGYEVGVHVYKTIYDAIDSKLPDYEPGSFLLKYKCSFDGEVQIIHKIATYHPAKGKLNGSCGGT